MPGGAAHDRALGGAAVYRQSLGLAVLEAVRRVDPAIRVRLGPSLGFAQQVLVDGIAADALPGFADRVEAMLHTLVDEGAALREERWAVDEAKALFRDEGSEAAALMSSWRDSTVQLVTYGSVHAVDLGPLLPTTALLRGFRVIAEGGVLVVTYGAESSARPLASMVMPVVPEASPGGREASDGAGTFVERHARRASAYAATLSEAHERWLHALGVSGVGSFNEACITGDVGQIVRVSEGFHEKRISAIADGIRERLPDVRVVCIAGPSSSGKTTFIRRLQVQLQVDGIRPTGLSLDDYYVDRQRTPRDASGEFDYEALEALRTDLLSEHVSKLLRGDSVKTARYDFATGESHPDGGRVARLGDREVLLLEGIHCLNPRLLAALPPGSVFRIFVNPVVQLPFDDLTRVHASDVRLLRRIVRDRHSRCTNAADTIQRWPSVRDGERRHIFPFQHHADAVFDSSLIYELAVLRVYAERYLLEVPRDHAAYTTALRLMRLLDRFVAIYPEHVPPNSLLREFIGGAADEGNRR